MARKYIRNPIGSPSDGTPVPTIEPEAKVEPVKRRRYRPRAKKTSRATFNPSQHFRDECKKLHRSLLERCDNENSRTYAKYGALGVQICVDWRQYELFEWWAFSHGYLPSEDGQAQVWLYRRDTDGDYTPDNCYFGEPFASLGHSQITHDITAFGETKSLVEWSKDPRCMVSAKTLESRINRCGWIEKHGIEHTLMTPAKRNLETFEAFGLKMTIRHWSKDDRCEVSYDVLAKRLQRGMEPEQAITTPVARRA